MLGQNLFVRRIAALVLFISLGAIVPTAAAATATGVEVTSPPTLDGSASDPAWAEATAFRFISHEDTNHPDEGPEVQVTMKFLYDDTYLYVLAQWPDDSWSVDKHVWMYSAGEQAWETSGNEDRLAILWNRPDAPIKDFSIDGCKMVCHENSAAPPGSPVAASGEPFLSTNDPGEKGDIWHWKAARTAAAGWADDQGISYDFSGEFEAARSSDSKESGGYSDNKQDLGGTTVPKYWEPTTTDSSDAAFILKSEVDSGEAVEIMSVDGDGTLHYLDGGVDTTVPSSARIPGYVVSHPVGSRGDIDAADSFDGSGWTVELRRALDTSDPDDVAFAAGGTYAFGVAVFNDSGGDEHSRSDAHLLRLAAESTTESSSSSGSEKTPGPGLLLVALSFAVVALASYKRRR